MKNFHQQLLILESDVATGRITRDQAIRRVIDYDKQHWTHKKRKKKKKVGIIASPEGRDLSPAS